MNVQLAKLFEELGKLHLQVTVLTEENQKLKDELAANSNRDTTDGSGRQSGQVVSR